MIVRPETPADVHAVRRVTVAAFPTADEADLVDALRADRSAWLDGLSYVAEVDGTVVAHALLTRCRIVGGSAAEVTVTDAAALAPCSVLPACQRTGIGATTIRALLGAARDTGERMVIVLGHADYYPRFGFRPASAFGITAPFEVPDEAFMALSLGGEQEVRSGVVRYPNAFGV